MFSQTRSKLKEAYDINFAATIERAEKQIILAKHGRRLLNLLDDQPVVPGDVRHPFAHGQEARQILNDAEAELQHWTPNLEPVTTSAAGLGTNLMPGEESTTASEIPEPSEINHPVATQESAATNLSPTKAHNTAEGSHLSEAIAS